MARFRKTLYLIVEGCVLVTLSVTAGVLVLHENVFRQLPLYCFLEEKAQERSVGQDRETYEKLMESNARYLGRMVVDENKEVGSQENDKEIVDKQTKRENEQNLKAEPDNPPPPRSYLLSFLLWNLQKSPANDYDRSKSVAPLFPYGASDPPQEEQPHSTVAHWFLY